MYFKNFFKNLGEKAKEEESDSEDLDTFFSKEYLLIHDLKTPLNGIFSMSQLMRRTSLNSEQTEYLDVIDGSIKDMLNRMDKISNSKLNYKIEFEDVESRIFIQDLYLKLSNKYRDKLSGYKIEKKFPFKIKMEREKIEILVEHIYDIFAKKIKHKVKIELTIDDIEKKMGLLIIKNENFDEISASENFSRDIFKGDLENYCDDLSSKCEILVDENLNYMVKIYFLYEEEKPEKTVFSNKKNDKKILIAEDEAVGRVTFKLILNDEYQIVFARNGKEAVEFYFSSKPDLVLMDIMMPKMNGFEAYDEIEKRDSNRCPVIACTSKVISTEREYLTSYGFDDHLDKPINIDDLNRILRKYFEL